MKKYKQVDAIKSIFCMLHGYYVVCSRCKNKWCLQCEGKHCPQCGSQEIAEGEKDERGAE